MEENFKKSSNPFVHYTNKAINTFLLKQNLTVVPKNFVSEFMDLSYYKMQHQGSLSVLAKEYNALLKDYYNALTAKQLHDIAKKTEDLQGYKKSMKKEDLAELLTKEYEMLAEFEDLKYPSEHKEEV